MTISKEIFFVKSTGGILWKIWRYFLSTIYHLFYWDLKNKTVPKCPDLFLGSAVQTMVFICLVLDFWEIERSVGGDRSKDPGGPSQVCTREKVKEYKQRKNLRLLKANRKTI